MWHVKVLPFPLLYFKLIDDIRIGLPDAVDPSLGRLDYASLLLSRKGCNTWILRITNSALTRRKDTSPWWVGPVPQFWGKPRTFLNPSSCFCHGADPIDGHRKVVGQDQYPALGEVRETAKLLPRGESPWWRDEGRHLLILCCFNPRDEISPHA